MAIYSVFSMFEAIALFIGNPFILNDVTEIVGLAIGMI